MFQDIIDAVVWYNACSEHKRPGGHFVIDSFITMNMNG